MTGRRRPVRVVLAILGTDQHEVGALAVSAFLRDAGIEVIYLGRFNLPATIVRAARDEHVHIIGLSCHSWEYLHYLDELMERLRGEGLDIPVVVGGSVLTPRDRQVLADKGTAATFGPGARAEDIVVALEELAARRHD